ncbi:NAD(P)/FAD-dependent oxidoreductase [Arthrobacter crusticola]|uniref:NAD(P)/FAD-dependent oxidoreductase n=1 Tax=Arthrobacter crusticola TaxID=2547960 RepID=A0A4R5TW43_9MICC|nr:NAD(P)/FAD-dependent oxidoreductase [Arthrobacter crusticola]TDK25357.1 NAD(P)/FAD-dependent oxidoreductase [Arthrobacter crusticola]
MTEVKTADVVVIGGGPVGENVADRAVRGGLTAVLVESELVGGECSYWACMPSKALIRSGAALSAALSLPGAREAVTGRLDAAQVLARRDAMAANWDDSGQAKWVAQQGITLARGHGRISGEREVEVTALDGTVTTIQARQAVVIATGSVPVVPAIEGLDETPFWGTRELVSAEDVPESITVIGAGVAGTELAQAFSRLGAKVTLIARSGILREFPTPAADIVKNALEKEGVRVLTNTGVRTVAKNGENAVSVTLDSGDTIESEKLLVATGRRPALDGLGLEDLGLSATGLPSDDTGRVRSAGDWLYVLGDAADKVMLTHQGKYEARAAGDAIAARAAGTLGDAVEPWGRYAATANSYAVPQVVFTDPEIAMVGRTLEQAQKDGVNASEVSLPIAVAGSALHSEGYTGWAQMIVDEDRRVIIGATLAGPDVAEMLHAATIAIAGEVPLERLWHAVPSFPTVSEVWLRLLEQYGL